MRKHHRAEHDVFRKLLGFGFDHHHRVLRARNDEVERTGGNLFVGRVEDIFAVDIADARAADRAHEGHTRKRQRSRGRDERQNIGLILAIIRKNLADHVDFVVETFGEQRTDRTIDQPRDQSLLFGRAAFALEEAARNTTGRRIFFLIMNGEREEILPFLDRACGRDGAKHNGFTERRENRAIGLTGNAPGFELEGLSAPLDFDCLHIKHSISFKPAAQCGLASCRCGRCARRRRTHRIVAAVKTKRPPEGGRFVLLAKTELRDQGRITTRVDLLEIIKQTATIVHQHQKAAPRMVILGMRLEMFGEVDDAFGEDRDLDFG